jgi:hypothetical protein
MPSRLENGIVVLSVDLLQRITAVEIDYSVVAAVEMFLRYVVA